MKKLFLMIILAAGLMAEAQNTLSISSGEGRAGDEVTVTLSLDNSTAVTAMQAFVPLGSNLQYVSGSATLTERSNGHQLSATVLRDTLRLYSYSIANNAYTGNSGALITFQLTLGREPGDFRLTPVQCILSNANGNPVQMNVSGGAITVRAPKVMVSPTSHDFGRVPIRSSYTRTVTVSNVGNEPLILTSVETCPEGYSYPSRSTVPCYLQAEQTTAAIAAGAQHEVTLTYSPEVAGETTMAAIFQTNANVGDSILTLTATPFSVNELRPLDVSGHTDGVVTVELSMNNMDEIVGLQTAIKLPSALTYVDGSFAPDATRAAGYNATAGMHGDTLTLLMVNISGTPIQGNNGVVARFSLQLHGYNSYGLNLLGTMLSDVGGNNVLSAVYPGRVNIYSPSLNCDNSVDLGSSAVTATTAGILPIYNGGNADLVISSVAYLPQDGWQTLSPLPMTVANHGRDTLHFSYSGGSEGSHNTEMLVYTNDPRNDLKRITLTMQRYEPNRLFMESYAGGAVSVMLDNYSDVTALQMDVKYPHRHFTLEPSDVTIGSRANGHTLNAVRQNDSTMRVLVLSMTNNVMNGNSGEVVRLQFHPINSNDDASYPVYLENITLGCTDGQNRLSNAETTGSVQYQLQLDDNNRCLVTCGTEQTIVCQVDIINRTATVIGYVVCNGELVIPETFEVAGHTYTITAIAPRAFYACDSLRSVLVPVTVMTYGDDAFAECPNLQYMTFKVRAAAP